MSPDQNKNLSANETKKRTTAGAIIAVALLVAVVGVFANAGLFQLSFDPSSYLNDEDYGKSQLEQGDDARFSNQDNASGDKADVEGESQEETQLTKIPEEGQAAGTATAKASATDGEGTAGNGGSGNGTRGDGDGDPNGKGPAGNGDGNKDDGGNNDDGNGDGSGGGDNGGSGTSGNDGNKNDPDSPPTVKKPAAMDGVKLLNLKHSGTAVFSTSDGKSTINPSQNLAGVKVTAVLYDEKSGTKWTRTLTYGNEDGQTYTISSDSFPVTADTTSVKVVYYLYGERYEIELPCLVGSSLDVEVDKSFFNHLNVDQNVSASDLKKHLNVFMAGKQIDLSLCDITGFDTSQGPGTYQATISYAGLKTTFNYVLNKVTVNFHTPETLVNCEERGWGHAYGFSPTDMKTRFNGTDMLSVPLISSTLDVSTYAQQLMGDLYWTEDCDGALGQGKDPNYTITYAKEGTAGQLDNWFVGWATADPSKAGGAVDEAWLQAHLVDAQLTAEDLAGIAKEQGSGGSVNLYPVLRSDTTISADGYVVKYNEVSANYAGYIDSLEYRKPAQLLAGFTSDAVKNGTLEVPAGVTYLSLSPYLKEAEDTSAYDQVKQLNLPIGMTSFDQTYPEYGWPYYSDKCGSYLSENVLPNVAGFTLPSAAENHGSSQYRTCAFTLEHSNGKKETLNGLVDSENNLVALPAGGVKKSDKLIMAEDTGVTVIATVAISHMEAKSIEFASSIEQFDTGALTSSQFDSIILNSAPVIMGRSFCNSSLNDEFNNLEHGYTSLILRTTEVPTFEYGGWETFLNKGKDGWNWDEEAGSWIYNSEPSDNTFANLKKEGIHIYVPDQDTLVRCYSAWAETIDNDYAAIDEEGNAEPQPVTAFLLRIENNDDQGEIYSDANNVVYMRSDKGDTILYAPATLSGYYMVPEKVTAIAPGAFAACTELEGVIVNPRADGKLPTLGEYAFGKPDETGYAAPSDTLKLYISSELKGESDWREALESQYWHTSDQDKAENAQLMVDMMLESDYESYMLNNASLYASTGKQTATDDDALALLRANENCKGVFEMPNGTVEIGAFAFAGCEYITGVANLDDVSKIGDTAFLDCKMLNVVALPAGLKFMGDSTFLGCSNLEAVAFNSAPKLGADLFEEAKIPTVFLPSEVRADESDKSTLKSALDSLGVSQYRECAYQDGVYSLMHDQVSWTGNIRYYRGLYTQSDTEGVKEATFAASRLGDASMGDDTQNINLDDEVTEIADGVFANQPLLMGVYGGDNVKTIGAGAFKDCAELLDVSLGSFDSKVEWVGDEAFSGCENLVTFAVPRDETSCLGGTFHVGDRAFKGCTKLEVTGYAADFYSTIFVLPSGTNIEIGTEAFEGCVAIPKISLPDGNVSIGERAFAGCTSIASIGISAARNSGSLSLGKDAFCDSPLTFVNLAGKQVTVESGALASASNMFGLFVSDGANVANDAFPLGAVSSHVVGTCPARVNAGSMYEQAGADGIMPLMSRENAELDTFAAITYPASGSGTPVITRVGDDVVEFFAYTLNEGSYKLGDEVFKDNQNLEKVSFGRQYGYRGAQVTSLGKEAFKGCKNLTNTGLEDDEYGNQSPVTKIGDSCYEGCTGLTSFGANAWTPLLTIGKAAFKDCTGIETVEIPLYTESVGDEAFKGCTALTEVLHWWASDAHLTDCDLGKSAFEGCSSLEEYSASAYIQSIGSDCFKGCDKLTCSFRWTGDPDDASTSNLPKLGAHPFGTNDDGSAIKPDAERIVIEYENALGGAVDTDADGLAKLLTDENGWLPFKYSFTYVDADGNETTVSKGKAAKEKTETAETDDAAKDQASNATDSSEQDSGSSTADESGSPDPEGSSASDQEGADNNGTEPEADNGASDGNQDDGAQDGAAGNATVATRDNDTAAAARSVASASLNAAGE